MYSHLHKDFPFNRNSSWLIGSYAGGKSEDADAPTDKTNLVNVNASGDTIDSFRKYYTEVPERQFLRAMAQQATEYWMWKQAPVTKFIGCTTYRRYLMLNPFGPIRDQVVFANIDQETCEHASSDAFRDFALHVMDSADIITNHSTILANTVEQQYLEWEPLHYWQLFKQAIYDLYPEYRKHLTWFTTCNIIHYETTYIMRREYFVKYAEEYFNILKYIFEHTPEVHPIKKPTDTFREIWPWRYPGFLGERFMPFFTYANGMKKHQVPMLFLGHR